MKICTTCNKNKPVVDFYKNTKYFPEGVQSECKVCMNKRNREYYIHNKHVKRDKDLNRLYGISSMEYNELLIKQNGCCAICTTKDPNKGRKCATNFCIDHDHNTGKVRGLLCSDCNLGLGKFQDNTQSLEAAIMYLKQNNTTKILKICE